ncbi:MAG TPA: hypothetical protein VFP90_00345 [Gemmatimonadaceae bacterium]|nr:hypothetical protein [Gemmatimonadaceae bacterium]
MWPLRGMAALLVALGVYPLANHLPFAEPQPWWRPALHAWVLWVPLLLSLALLLARHRAEWWDEQAERSRRALLAPSPRRFMILVGALTCVLSLAAGWLMFGWSGATIDEYSQLWQAHLLTSGRLFAGTESHPEFFSTMQTVSWQGRWFSHFPIGGPAIQALGLLVGAPQFVNPLLAGCAAVAVYRFIAAVGTETEARATALLFATSPFVLIVAGSRLDHVPTITAVWIALAALPGWLASTRDAVAYRRAVVIGLALGCATAIRPYDGVIATAVIGGFQLLFARRAGLWRSLIVQAAAAAVPIAALLAANHALTGHALTFAYDILNGPDHRPGFHMSPLGYEHTPMTGLYSVSLYLMRLNETLLGWPVPVVALMAITLATWREITRWDYLLLALVITTIFAYWIYWGEGSFHGPRFYFDIVPVFLLLVARFPRAARERLRRPVLRTAASMLVPLCILAAWLVPSRTQPFGPWSLLTPRNEIDLTRAVRRTIDDEHLAAAVVFVNDGWHARLAARMRAIGMPPYTAQLIIGNYNACTLERRLDEAERRGMPPEAATAYVASVMREPLDARPVPGLSAMEQLALPKSADVPDDCRWDFDHALAPGIDLARLLPLIALDSAGMLGGDVVYARDFGARIELLAERFPDRAWYVAHPEVRGDTVAIVVEPYARGVRWSGR